MRRGAYRIDWASLAVATLIVVACLLYLADARSVSLDIQNLLLVQPTAVFALVVYAFVVPQCFHRADTPRGQESTGSTGLARAGATAAAVGFYVFSLETIGFDVATWLFVLVILFVLGERRLLMLALFPTLTTLMMIWAMRAMIPLPFPTSLLFKVD